MIMSVSTLIIGSGAAMPRSVVNLCMALFPVPWPAVMSARSGPDKPSGGKPEAFLYKVPSALLSLRRLPKGPELGADLPANRKPMIRSLVRYDVTICGIDELGFHCDAGVSDVLSIIDPLASDP